MKIKELIKKLSGFNQEAEVFVSSDEELNAIFSDIVVAYMIKDKEVVLWGNPGSEVEE